MDNQSTAKKNQNNQKVTLSRTLDTVPAVEGVEALLALHRAYTIVPAVAAENILPALDELGTVLSKEALTTSELAGNPCTVLSILTGLSGGKITEYHRTDVAEPLHTYRNLGLAVAALAAATIREDSAGTEPATVYSHAVRLQRRSTRTRRPAAHDEIVLFRVAAHLAARTDPRDHATGIYTLSDAGQAPGETTHVTIKDFDDPEMPQFVLAAGNGHLAARFVPLDPWTSHTLGRHLEHARRAGHSASAPLTYRGWKHQPGSQSATVSAHQALDRFLAPLRLPTGDLTVGSISQWRVANVLETQGVDAAVEISGRKNAAAMFRALGERTDKATTERPDDDGISFAA